MTATVTITRGNGIEQYKGKIVGETVSGYFIQFDPKLNHAEWCPKHSKNSNCKVENENRRSI